MPDIKNGVTLKNSSTSSDVNTFDSLLNLIFLFTLPLCFKNVDTIFRRNTFQEIAFTSLTCCINQLTCIAYLKKDIKNPYLRRIVDIMHKMFVYLNVIVTSIETGCYLYVWFCIPNGLNKYTPSEAIMSRNQQIISFILIRLIPLLSSLFIFLASDEKVSKLTVASVLIFFPLYLVRLRSYHRHYGSYPHPLLETYSKIDMNVLCILLTVLAFILLLILKEIKRILLKYKSENVENPSRIGSFIHSALKRILEWYSFFSNIFSIIS